MRKLLELWCGICRIHKKQKMRVVIIIGLVVALLTSSIEGKSQYREDFAGGPPSISKSIHIYPNPTNESDYVNVGVAPFKSNKIRLALHNIIGNELPVEIEIVDEHELRVRVKDLPSGYYLLTVKDMESSFRGTYKILKR
jgi:hypothetical protein